MTATGIARRKRVLVLGGGTAGTSVANRLRRLLPEHEAAVTVIDADDAHLYQPGLLFVPFGTGTTGQLTRSRRRYLARGVDFLEAAVEWVDIAQHVVHLVGKQQPIGYDVLVVATGARLVPEETEGLIGAGWNRTVHTFYDAPGATRLAAALADLARGRLVVNVVDLPIKCPVAPLEFAFLADAFLRRRSIRDQVTLTYVTPLDGAFTKPVASRELAGMLEKKGIELITEFNTGTVDAAGRRLISYDGREVPFDLAVVVPLHSGADYVTHSPGLGDELGFIPVDEHTLQSIRDPHVFAIGDAAAVPASKAGSVAHFEGHIVAANVCSVLAGAPPSASFDGHTNCFIESGDGKALLIDFNYDTEPLRGTYPGRVGFPLLRESRLNHLGKLAFEHVYWHVLLPGHDIPGTGSAMPRRGKPVPEPVR